MSSKRLTVPSYSIAKTYGHLLPFGPMLPMIPYNATYHMALVDIARYQKYKDSFVIKDNDILITTYPKCGTHLLRKTIIEIIRANNCGKNTPDLYETGDIGQTTSPWMAYYLCGGVVTDDEIHERLSMTNDIYPHLWTNHHSYSKLTVKSFEPNSKIICIIRHPKAQIVSGTAFYDIWNKKFIAKDAEQRTLTLDEYMSYFLRGIMPQGCYFDFYESYWNVMKDNKHNILWLYYEDMVDYPLENIKKIARFIYDNSNEKSMYNFTEKAFQQIVQRTTFDNMKQESINNPQTYEIYGLFRKGKKDDWMNHLTEEQSELIDETMYFKWAENCSDIKYYRELKDKFNAKYNKGYFL
eukprot:187173_1